MIHLVFSFLNDQFNGIIILLIIIKIIKFITIKNKLKYYMYYLLTQFWVISIALFSYGSCDDDH